MPEHVTIRVNDHYYVCEECGAAGSERWAILHQFPTNTSELFYSMGDTLRRWYLESVYDTPEEFLASLDVPDYPEPPQFPRY